ncbi:MAG: septum formation initiator family protein [Bdellovibrionota bacterium]
MDQLRNTAFAIQRWLSQPQKVFFTCLMVLVATLFLNGTLWKLWGLYRDEDTIVSHSLQAKAQMRVIDTQIKQATDTTYIERQARDKMDLVGDHDLIFVFPE